MFFWFFLPSSGSALFMFTEGRPLDWEKEKIFVFRSVYSNVVIDSVLIPIAFFGINEAYLILDKRNNSDNILKYPIKIAAAFPSLLLYSYDCCCVYYTYVLFSALKVCFWHYLIDYIFVQNIAEWESHSLLNMLLKVFLGEIRIIEHMITDVVSYII